MSDKLVLITGATGHVGFPILTLALDSGYHVRAAVRSEEKAKSILESGPLKSRETGGSQLTFAIVPDLSVPGAYDEAVKGVQYIIHVASPVPDPGLTPDQFQAWAIDPAVKGTLGLLESAHKISGIRRIVITSSIVAMASFEEFCEGTDKVFTAEDRIPTPDISNVKHTFHAYMASKTKAFNEAEKWMAQKQPTFDLIHIHPTYVLGREELQTSRQFLRTHSTNQFALKPVVGQINHDKLPNGTVHLQDVARVHVSALSPNIPGNTSYITSSNNPPGTFNSSDFGEVPRIVAKHFPEAVASGVLPNNGCQPFFQFKVDVRKTEETFGFAHLSFEEQVKDVVSHYLELDPES